MALTIVKKEISLNVGQPNNFELICAMQGDSKSFEITATLYDVNKLYTINTNNIKIQGINPVGLKIDENIDSHTTNTVTFTLTEKMLMYDGILRLVIIFTDSGQLTTFPFIIKVVNAPGNTTVDEAKTVSELVEEAKKWAMLSKSYAVGTDNVARPGDSTDNSKYYYELIKKLLGNGVGSANIRYYDTYEEFETDAKNIPTDTLILIKEEILDVNSGGNTGDIPKIVTFTDATDAEIAAMLDAHYNNVIDIKDYWNVGDTRKIHLSAMNDTYNLYDTHIEQDITIVIIDFDHDDLVTPINGHTKSAITVQTREVLGNNGIAEMGCNHTRSETNVKNLHWGICTRRTWCNDIFYNAISSTIFRDMLKKVKKKIYTVENDTRSNDTILTDDVVFFISLSEANGYEGSGADSKDYLEDGTKYQYYRNRNNIQKYANKQGSPGDKVASWNTRSIDSFNLGLHYIFNDGHAISDFMGWQISGYIAPAWCM